MRNASLLCAVPVIVAAHPAVADLPFTVAAESRVELASPAGTQLRVIGAAGTTLAGDVYGIGNSQPLGGGTQLNALFLSQDGETSIAATQNSIPPFWASGTYGVHGDALNRIVFNPDFSQSLVATGPDGDVSGFVPLLIVGQPAPGIPGSEIEQGIDMIVREMTSMGTFIVPALVSHPSFPRDQTVWFSGDATGVDVAVQPGDPIETTVPDGELFSIQDAKLNADGLVAILGNIQSDSGSESGVFARFPGEDQFAPIALTGDTIDTGPLAGQDIGSFSDRLGDISDVPSLLFDGYVGPDFDHALMLADGSAQTLVNILATGSTVPGYSDDVNWIIEHGMAPTGDLYALVELESGSNFVSERVLLVAGSGSPADLHVVMASEAPAPGGGSFLRSGSVTPTITNTGYTIFSADVDYDGDNQADARSLFAAAPNGNVQRLLEGSYNRSFPEYTAGARLGYIDFDLYVGTAGSNPCGKVSAVLAVAGVTQTYIVVVFDLPSIDRNCDGQLNIDDVLDFLSDFASGGSASDMNFDGTFDIDDVLAYLGAFAGS